MDAIQLALDGYLAAEPEPGDREGTASWRLNCSAFGQAALGPGQNIRIHISPTGALGSGLEHCRSFDVTPAMAHRLADYIDAMSCYLNSEHPEGVVLAPETIADLTELCEDIDLIDLTNTVLNATRPEHRPAVTQAMDDMFGDVPAPEDTDP